VIEPPAEQVCLAAVKLGGPVPYVERELASILSVWLKSVYRRKAEGDVPPDWNYALEVAQLVLRRGLPRKVWRGAEIVQQAGTGGLWRDRGSRA
jgi:hypothetical protein